MSFCYLAGSTLEAMADAIEQASVVMVCISETYKNSPSCRTGMRRVITRKLI